MQKTCIKLLNKEMACTNAVYMVSDDGPRTVCIKGKTFPVEWCEGIGQDVIALSGFQRKLLNVEVGQKLTIHPCESLLPTTLKVKLSVSYRGYDRVLLRENDVVDELYSTPRILNQNQKIVLKLNSKHILVCTVLEMKEDTAIANRETIYEFDLERNQLLKWESARGFCPSIRACIQVLQDGEYTILVKDGKIEKIEKVELKSDPNKAENG